MLVGGYFEMDVDDRGDTHAVRGEGLNYEAPGSIWYRPVAPARLSP